MSVDLYAGPLCLYFARDWDSEAASIPGRPTVVVGPGGVMKRENPIRYLDMFRGWKRVVAPVLRRAGADGVEWDERIDAPYFTRRYDWRYHHGLRIVASYIEFPEFSCPDSMPTDAGQLARFLGSDVALACVKDAGRRGRFAHLHLCLHWLPIGLPRPRVGRVAQRTHGGDGLDDAAARGACGAVPSPLESLAARSDRALAGAGRRVRRRGPGAGGACAVLGRVRGLGPTACSDDRGLLERQAMRPAL